MTRYATPLALMLITVASLVAGFIMAGTAMPAVYIATLWSHDAGANMATLSGKLWLVSYGLVVLMLLAGPAIGWARFTLSRPYALSFAAGPLLLAAVYWAAIGKGWL